MRDILLTLTITVLLPFVFKFPVFGAYLWAWVSMMVPHRLTHGFAAQFPFAQVIAILTLLVFLFTKQKRRLPISPITVLLLLLLGWMTLTSFFAVAPVEDVFERWLFVLKIQIMLLITLMLVLEGRQLRWLIWVVTMSVAFYGIKGGVWTILTGGGGRVWGPPSGLIAGNNEFAVALVMLLPFMYWLRQTSTNRWVRILLLLSVVACAFAILGSQSRGALLALLSITFVLGLKSKYRIQSSLGLITLVIVAISFMPESWVSRMETIGTYTSDTSAMSRVWTWKTLWAAAVDRPLVGVGFRADNLEVFNRYAPTDPEFAIFFGRVWVAHSIYFQMLGEHGFVGLGLFLLLGLTAYRRAGVVAEKALAVPEFAAWLPLLMRMTQVSLIGFATGGAFLSLAYLDLAYYVIGYVILGEALVLEANSKERAAAKLAGERSVQQARLANHGKAPT